MARITDPDSLNQGTEIDINTGTRTIKLNEAGNLSSDGVTIQALYSFLKEEWKNDSTLIPYDFPLIAVTPQQMEFVQDWKPADNATRKLIRNGGWRELNSSSVLEQEYAGITTLGSFEDPNNDTAYYQVGDDPTDTSSAIDFTYAGPVNEAILIYENNVPADESTGFDFTTDTISRNDGGDWITDGYKVGAQITVRDATTSANNGTFVITAVTSSDVTVENTPFTADTGDNTANFARNYRNKLKLFLRVRDADPNGKTFAQADLSNAGVQALSNQVFAFPLSNSTDLKISETDANISSQSPYTEIELRYFDQSFSRDVDTEGTPRDFGIVVDVGTHSGVDGDVTNGGSTLTSAEGGIPTSTYDSGELVIHEGSNKGTYTVTGTTATEVTISGTFPATESNLSFTLQRQSPVVASAEEIYEKIQYQLRQASDIDVTDQVVTGKTADEILNFVGDNLNAGTVIPSNPNGGGSGVIIEGFDSNDTNRLTFTDNSETERTFPFVSAGTINFNANLVSDSGGQYWMFFEYTTRTTVSDGALSGITGFTASLDSAGSNLPTLAQNDYINIEGFADENNNGIWQVIDPTPSATQADIYKVNEETISTESATSITVDENPIDSDDALIVDNNAGADISGAIGSASTSFDFDYDGNVQGGRTAGNDASIVLRAIGLETAQFVEATGTITRATGLSFTLVSALERNYENPA